MATAYLETTRSVQNAEHEIDLRWRALRKDLAEQGADAATLEAMEAGVGTHRELPGPQGQVLVGTGGRLACETALPHPPRRETARWAPLPHLMPLVAQLAPVVPWWSTGWGPTCGCTGLPGRPTRR